ncbi:MAG: choice-of-anchor J domain-containing protein [Bacteroidales bacterium]|nr:choice-of-anchor J domain-containing protein [Bacteroidales bacterium]
MKKFYFIFLFLLAMICTPTKAQVFFHQEFNGSLPAGWQNKDSDGDGYKWQFSSFYAISYSYYNKALSPNNWLITNQIDLTNITPGTNGVELNYYVAIGDKNYPAEHYQVLVSTSGTNYSDFSVVFEETLNSTYENFKNKHVDLSAYAGQKIYIAFAHNNCQNQYLLAIAYPIIVGADEISLESITTDEYTHKGDDIVVSGTIYNEGTAPMTAADITYNVDGGAESVVEHLTGLNIAQGSTATFTHSVKIPTSAPTELMLNVTISNPNNANDATYNNVLSQKITIYDKKTSRRTLVEQFITANCGNCPDATKQLSQVMAGRNDVCWIAHHGGYGTDGLTHHNSVNNLLGFYNNGGYCYTPGLMLDRTIWDDGNTPVFNTYEISTNLLDRATNIPAFVSVNITDASYDSQSRQVSITISGEVLNAFKDNANDLRLSLYLKEDNLKTTPGQAGSNLGTNYVHNNVMRANISGVWGDANIITNTAGSTYTKTYTFTIPENYVENNLTFIAFASRYNSVYTHREVLNAKGVKLTDIINNNLPANDVVEGDPGTGSSIDESSLPAFELYPNPANNVIYISSQSQIEKVEIYNLEGKLMKSIDGNTETISIQNLTSGLYFVRCLSTDGVSVRKFIKQ